MQGSFDPTKSRDHVGNMIRSADSVPATSTASSNEPFFRGILDTLDSTAPTITKHTYTSPFFEEKSATLRVQPKNFNFSNHTRGSGGIKKEAGLKDWFSQNWNNAKYLTKHKYYVYRAGRELDVPRLQLLKHDLSKLTPSEWGPYRRYWFGQKTPEVVSDFRQATSQHKSRNPHHHPSPTDINTNLEAIADWYSAGRAQGQYAQTPFKNWVEDRLRGFPVNDVIKNEVKLRLDIA